MIHSIKYQHAQIVKASKRGWKEFEKTLSPGTQNELIKADWRVEYSKTGHDMIMIATVSTIESADSIVQVWLKDLEQIAAINEWLPWVSGALEFESEQHVQRVKVGLIDHKWHKTDAGKKYCAFLWGFFLHKGEVLNFAFTRKFVYPG